MKRGISLSVEHDWISKSLVAMNFRCGTCSNWSSYLANETYEGKPLGLCGRLGLKFNSNFYCKKYEKRD